MGPLGPPGGNLGELSDGLPGHLPGKDLKLIAILE